jgi:hypothetical protein
MNESILSLAGEIGVQLGRLIVAPNSELFAPNSLLPLTFRVPRYNAVGQASLDYWSMHDARTRGPRRIHAY